MFNQHMRIAIDKYPYPVIRSHRNAYRKTISPLKMLSSKIFYELFAYQLYCCFSYKKCILIKEGTKVPSTSRHEPAYLTMYTNF
jgi:hypothetical protein